MEFRIGSVPVGVEPWFLLTAFLIRPFAAGPVWTAVWIAVVFLGVLVHELGHAVAGSRYGLRPWILIHAFGGSTGWHRPRPLAPGRDILVSAAGSAVGVTVGLAAWIPLLAGAVDDPTVGRILSLVVWVNLGWGVLNLLPVLPLDGGRIALVGAEAAFGRRGRTAAWGVSLALTTGLVAVSAWHGWWWTVVLGSVLTIANGRALRNELGDTPRR